MKPRPHIGDRLVVRLPDDEVIICQIKALSRDDVVVSWPHDSGEMGWVADRRIISLNADGGWSAFLSMQSQ